MGAQKLVFGNNSQTVALHKLLGEGFGAFSTEHQSGYQGDADRDVFVLHVLERVQREVNDISFCQARTYFVDITVVYLLIERDVEDLED